MVTKFQIKILLHILVLSHLIVFFISNCSPPSAGNLCDPNTKEHWQTKLLLMVSDISPGITSCLNYIKYAKVNIYPLHPLGKMLKRDTTLEFSFDQYISTNRCTFSSGVSTDDFIIKYEKLSDTKSKVLLSPISKWTAGIERELGIFCTADNGNQTISPYIAKYSFADGFRFVSVSGNDSNSGLSESEPLATISMGITKLSSSSDCDSAGKNCYVLVGKGNYSISSTITMLNRISLIGSYSSDYLTRNADPFSSTYDPTILTDSRISTGGGISTPISTFLITGNVNKDSTEINGFHIKPPTTGTGFSSALLYTSITDTGIIFKSNKIELQNPGYAYGIYTDTTNGGDLISNHIIQSGTYTGTSVNGIYLNSTGNGFSKIESNTITLGTCSGVSCIMSAIATNSSGGASLITKNTFNLGNGTAANASVNGFYPFCSNTSPDMTLSENIIKGTSCSGNACIVSGMNLSVSALISKITITGNEINPGYCTSGSCETRGIYITGNNSTTIDMLSNTIYGGDSSATTSGTTYGLKLNTAVSSFINFKSNKVYTGSSQSGFGISVGIKIGATGGGEISKNFISGGSGNLVFALWGTPSSNIPILQNIFIGGTSNSSGNATVDINLGNQFLSNLVISGKEITGPSSALKISGGSSQLYHNTIVGRGNGSNSYALQFSAANTVDVGHNLIVTESGATNRYCVYEDAAGQGPQTFSDNALYDCPTGYYYDPDSANSTKTAWCSTGSGTFSIAGCASPIASPTGTLNISPVNPVFFDSGNSKYCLSSSSPSSISSGTANNITATDITGATRPNGNRAFGAYEPNSTCN